MEEVPPEAIVVSVKELWPEGRGVAKTFTVEAKMYVPAQKFSKGIYRVKFPLALADEYSMEDGKFWFDTVEEVKVNQRFKISILPATS